MHKDVFVALCAIAWADGKLDADEADAIVRAAVDEGMPLEEIAAIEAATQKPVDIGFVERAVLSKEDRLFVYAVAWWIARMDGRVTAAESDALAKLGQRLGIPEHVRVQAEGVSRDIADLPEGDRPLRYDLSALRRMLGERLAAASAPGAARENPAS
jgi:uncharacterized membrane protein YebE (DUF533 family)